MNVSALALVSNVERDGRVLVGYGFSSNGRYSQSGLLRERFIPRLLGTDPKSSWTTAGGTSTRTRSGRS